jgi:hypothetical protein
VLGDEQDGATPLAADGEPLEEAQHHQQRRGPVSDLGERGQATHEHGHGAHQQQAELQQLFAPVPVSKLTEDEAAHGSGGEADGVGHKGGKDGIELVAAARKNTLLNTSVAAVP